MVTLDNDLQQKVNAAIRAGAPQLEAISRAQAIQEQRSRTSSKLGTSVMGNSGISGILGTMIRPFERATKTAGAAGYELLRPLLFGGDKQNQYFDPETRKARANPFLTEKDLNKFGTAGGATKETAKTLAGLASYAVPFGKGVNITSRALLPGAATGALFEASAPETSANKMITSAITGAATAGVLDKLLGGLTKGKLREKAITGKEKVIKPIVDKSSPLAYQQSRDLAESTFNLGLKGSAKNQSKQVGEIFTGLNQAADDLARGSNNTYDKLDVFNKIKNKLKGKINTTSPVGKEELELFWTRLSQEGDTLTDIGLRNVQKQANEVIGGLYGPKGKVVMDKAMSQTEIVNKAARDAISEIVGKNNKPLQDVLSQIAKIYEVSPGINKMAEQTVRIPFGGGIRASTRLGQSVQDLVARGRMNLSNKIPEQGLSSLVAPITRGSQYLRGSQQQQEPQLPTTQQPVQETQQQTNPLEQMLTPEFMQQAALRLSPKEFNRLKEAYSYTTEKGNAAKRKRSLILQQASPVLLRITESAMKAPTGIMGSLGALFGKLPGVAGGEAEYLSRDTEAFARLIASAFASEVGVATDKDVQRWKGMMPQPGDTAAERKRQMTKMIEQIYNEANATGMDVPPSLIQALQLLQ